MTPRKVRKVNVLPVMKIKHIPESDVGHKANNGLGGEDDMKEKTSDDDDDPFACRICCKGFASEMACLNHAKLEHFQEFVLQGKDVCVRQIRREESIVYDEEMEIRKTAELISSMQPADLTSLASNDVEYIIIRAEDPQPKKPKKKEKAKTLKMVKGSVRKEIEALPITGPFECMQPSTVADEEVCHQVFQSCCEYSVHYRDDHTRRRKGLRCQVCEKPLGSALAPHSCQVCGTAFESNKELQEHSQTAHIKLKPFQCSVCQKRFTQQGGLQQHMRMHTGDRPYQCTFCSKAFTQKGSLDLHLRIHTKVRPYRCVICSKSFCQSIHLQQHMRTHTNVTPFQCEICQKRFKQGSLLNYHIKNHNPANLTDEQKITHAKLLDRMRKCEVLEVEYDPGPTVVVEIDQTVPVDDDEIPEADQVYVIGEDGNATLWSAEDDS